MIRIKGVEHPICFDVRSKAGEIHNLITDPAHDVTINTLIIPAVTLNSKGEQKTFIGQVSVQLEHHVIIVTHDAVFFDTKVLEWIEERTKHFGGSHLTFTSRNTLSIIEIIIKRSAHRDPDTGKVDFLNVYVNDEDYFSKHTTGLIGQFVNGHKHIIMKKEQTQPGGKLIGKFQVKERPANSTKETKPTQVRHAVRGTLVNRSEVVTNGTELCWMVHEKFEELLLGKHEQFLVDEFIKQDI